jgi:DNA-binding LacI/PurR family transcriptional regulator
MARLYGCNFLTVRKALKQLVEEGWIVRKVGSGTFVERPSGATSGQDEAVEVLADVNTSQPRRLGVQRVGVLVLTSSNTYANRLLQSIAHTALDEGIDISSRWVRDFTEDALVQAEQLRDEGCLALVLPWFPFGRVEEVRGFVQRCPLQVSLPMPIVGLERNCFVNPIHFGQGSQRTVEALVSYYQALGVEHLAFLGPESPRDTILQKTLTAYACRLARDGLANLTGLVAPGTHAMDQLVARWREYSKGGQLGIICYDDEHALRFMTAMHKVGLCAPEDYRIIGFNDTDASAFSDPPLSTMPQNFDDVSTWLLRNALALSRGEVAQSAGGLKPRLLVRDTCGGKGVVDEALCERLPDLKFIFEEKVEPEEGDWDSADV